MLQQVKGKGYILFASEKGKLILILVMKTRGAIVFEIIAFTIGEPTYWYATCRLGTEIKVNNEEIIEEF